MKQHVFPVNHNALITHTKGKAVVTCSCGWIGNRTADLHAAREQHDMHKEQAYLYERSPKLEPVPWS